jgi:hypothetical protein
MLAHGSTAQFSLSISQSASRWLDNHAWAGFVLGLGLLAIAVLWPEIKQYLPRLPKTIHERLRELEVDRIPGLMKTQESHNSQICARSDALESQLVEQRDWLSGLERSITVLGPIEKCTTLLIEALGAIPSVIQRLSEYDRLLGQAADARDELESIRTSYPSSPFSLAPLSVAWRPTSDAVPLREDIIAGVNWIRLLEVHCQRVSEFCVASGDRNQSEQLMGRLYQCVTQHAAVSGEFASEILLEHIIEIRRFRKDYAAAVTGNFSAISTRSAIDHTC